MTRPRIFVSLILILLLGACRPSVPEKKMTGRALGTTYHIRVQGKGEPLERKDIENLIADLNRSLSTYISSSLISRINRGDTLKADIHFRRVFEAADRIYRASGGIYDPTVGILVNAWGFGPGKRIPGLDTMPHKVDSLRRFVGWNLVSIDSAGYVRKEHPAVFLDFNSIAKGYIIDRIGDLIASKGYENYLVELGGEVLARGSNIREGRPWLVAVDYPLPGKERFAAAVELHDQAIATSGNYRKYRIDKRTGRKYVHTLNPFTGYPEPSDLLSASVIAPDCTTADGWATACMAAGTEKAKTFLTSREELEGILIYSDSTGRLRIWKTPGIKLTELPAP
ncbi:MAG: FAD:protein FMN transferase [Chlorobi bacterium]|nr:FAD:protein FMN transferase [Chlorobiota bacterium]